MLNCKIAFKWAMGGLCAVALSASAALAVPPFKTLEPLLVDLPGFAAKAPTGMTLDSGSGAMSMAAREYTKGSTRMTAALVVGDAAKGVLAPIATNMRLETSEGHMLIAEIAGMKTLKTYNITQKGGAIIVALADDAAFTLSYTGVDEDAAVQLLQKFDLKGLQAAAAAK